MSNKLIYVADDELNIRELIKSYLLKEGYLVEIFSDGASILKKFKENPSDMLIIDIMMPELNGYELCKEIRKISEVPIIIVSAKDEEIDRILGLELGSDDYLAKPFSVRELVIRVNKIFKRVEKSIIPEIIKDEVLICRDIKIFPKQRQVLKDETPLELTTKEYDFLSYMITYKNIVFKREQLIEELWGYDYIGDTRAIDDLVKRIRKKLKESNSTLEIITVWGFGYKISE